MSARNEQADVHEAMRQSASAKRSMSIAAPEGIK
jgi:hypothetical protein